MKSRARSMVLLLAVAAQMPALAEAAGPVTPIVMTCVDARGRILATKIVQSSNDAAIDKAALKIARKSKYVPATDAGKPLDRSCVEFQVRFVGERKPVRSRH